MKKILCMCLLFFAALNATAQTMSDDQVIKFVQQEQAKGGNQQTIVQRLLRRGVTVEQLRRVRKKYEAEQKNMGAVDLTGKTASTGNNRLRTSKEKAQDQSRRQSGYLVRSQREREEERYKTRQMRQSDLEAEIGFLDLDSVLYYQNLEKPERQVFGRNIFNNELLTFEPGQNMATPTNYRLGAGDKVIIDVWGASQQTFEGVISPDGYLVVEGAGPIRLSGLSVQQASERVRGTLGPYYQDCQISLSLGENRSIQVQVMGEVRTPGTYTLSSLSTAFNALYAAGGISEIGTLRSIKVYRNGRLLNTLDVYDYLLNGNAGGDIRLQDNDLIMVGPYECLVQVTGKVKRPMFYEMKPTETVKQVLKNAGGFTGDAYTKHVRLTRKAGGAEYSMHTVDEFQMSNFGLKDGDSLFVDSVVPRFTNLVEVRGAVMRAGQYELGGDIQSVRGLLQAAEGLREDAFQTRAVMHRQKEDLTLEMLSIDLEKLLQGETPDIPLRKGDVLFVPSNVDMKGERTLTISGEVLYPGVYQFAENTTVEDLILMAGGLTEAASMAKVDVFRRIQDYQAVENTGRSTETFSLSLNDGLRHGDTSFALQPYDEVVVRRSPAYSEQQNVRITGCVNFEGDYAMTSQDYRLSDLIQAAGGLSALAYSKGARLTRKMTEDEKLQRESTMRAAQIQMYEEAMRNEKGYNMTQADSLMSLKLDLGDYYPVAVSLERAMANPGGSEDIVLREGDVLNVPQYSNTVKISGEVTYPLSLNYKKGEPLKYYIERAGGYGNRAKKRGAYAVYINGAAKKIGRRSSKDIQPGCEIVVPTKEQSRRMTTGEVTAISSGAASLASVIVALISILK